MHLPKAVRLHGELLYGLSQHRTQQADFQRNLVLKALKGWLKRAYCVLKKTYPINSILIFYGDQLWVEVFSYTLLECQWKRRAKLALSAQIPSLWGAN